MYGKMISIKPRQIGSFRFLTQQIVPRHKIRKSLSGAFEHMHRAFPDLCSS
jgi:hypothetical protein